MTGGLAWVLFPLLLLLEAASLWHSYEDVTVHVMWCAGDRFGGQCSKGEETANPTTYRAFVNQQTVIKWTWNSGRVSRFTFCAVRDGQNWSCKFERAEEAPKVEYTMSDGVFSTTDFRTVGDKPLGSTPSDPFYAVPRWYWWYVWTLEQLGQRAR